MERDGSFAFKLGSVMEQCSQHSANSQTQPCTEIIQYNFWFVIINILVILPQLSCDLNVTQFEMCSRPIR